MNLETIKHNIFQITLVPRYDRAIHVQEVRSFLDNPENKVTEKQKESGLKYLQSIFKKWDRAELAAEKVKEKILQDQKKQAERIKKLGEENPYYLDTANGMEREVDLSVSTSYGMRLGRFTGKAHLALPSAVKWAKFSSDRKGVKITVVDFANPEKPILASFL